MAVEKAMVVVLRRRMVEEAGKDMVVAAMVTTATMDTTEAAVESPMAVDTSANVPDTERGLNTRPSGPRLLGLRLHFGTRRRCLHAFWQAALPRVTLRFLRREEDLEPCCVALAFTHEHSRHRASRTITRS